MTAGLTHITRPPAVQAGPNRRFAIAVLLPEAVLLAIAALRHRPWFDEAQAWLLARDTSPFDLIVHHLRYEGSPGLWHLLLMGPAKLGLPFQTMAVISVAATLAGSAILLLRSPFPRPIAILICFSFFLFFQYGVVARSYCLLGPLLFHLAAGWRDKLRHPVRTFLLLTLLANVSLHGLLICLALAAIYALELRRAWQRIDGAARRRTLRAIAVFGGVVATVVLELLPPEDLAGGGSWHFGAPWDMFGSSLVTRQLPIVIPSLLIVAASLWWFRLRRCLLVFALPAAGLGLLFMFRYFSPWHMGALFLVWIFALWVSLDGLPHAPEPTSRIRRALLGAVAAALAGQVVWTAMSLQYDWTHSYSGGADVATYIQDQRLQDGRIDLIGKWGVAVLPYFPEDIFHNFNHGRGPSYYPWTWEGPITGRTSDVLLDNPDVIVVSVKSRDGATQLPCLPGYREQRSFPGGIYWPGGVMETESFALFVRDQTGGEQRYWGNCGVL